MAKIHINAETGKTGSCNASKRPCPLGGDSGHFENEEEARSVYEAYQKVQFGENDYLGALEEPGEGVKTIAAPDMKTARQLASLAAAEGKYALVLQTDEMTFTVKEEDEYREELEEAGYDEDEIEDMVADFSYDGWKDNAEYEGSEKAFGVVVADSYDDLKAEASDLSGAYPGDTVELELPDKEEDLFDPEEQKDEFDCYSSVTDATMERGPAEGVKHYGQIYAPKNGKAYSNNTTKDYLAEFRQNNRIGSMFTLSSGVY